jgi:hypothetical protein
MDLSIRTEDGAGTDLYRWLNEDPELRGQLTITPASADRAGEMGLGFDLLNLIIPNTIALGSLVASIASFRQARRQGTGTTPRVSIGQVGVYVDVDVDDDGHAALQQLQAGQQPQPYA